MSWSEDWDRREWNPASPYYDPDKYPPVERVCEGCLTTFPEDEVERCPLSGNWYCPECMIEEEKKAALEEEAASINQ